MRPSARSADGTIHVAGWPVRDSERIRHAQMAATSSSSGAKRIASTIRSAKVTMSAIVAPTSDVAPRDQSTDILAAVPSSARDTHLFALPGGLVGSILLIGTTRPSGT
jgi:hypothetical protein